MIYIFIGLLLVSGLESRIIRSQRAASCSWEDHCAGDPCSIYDDCDDALVCLNGKCGTNSNSGSNGQSETCSSSGSLEGTR